MNGGFINPSAGGLLLANQLSEIAALGTLAQETARQNLGIDISTTGTMRTARFHGDDGTAALPTFSFHDAGNMGFYKLSTTTMSASVGGVERWRWSGADFQSQGGQLLAANGSAIMPSLSFFFDPDTGLYSPGGNSLSLVTGGLPRWHVAPTGALVSENCVFSAAGGTAANPGIGFRSNTSTGLYLIGAGNMGLAADGAKIVDVAYAGGVPRLGFFGTAHQPKPAITGSRGGNAALASLLTALATLGLVTDGTSA